MHLVIRADGGPELGYGHLFRSNALSEQFLTRNHVVTIATDTPLPVQSIFSVGINIVKLPTGSKPGPFTDWLDENQPDAVFTDSYEVDTEYQCAVRDRVPLAVLQDDDRHAVCADLFVNGNLYAPELDYEFVGEDPKTCLGADYVLLRSEIRDRIKDEPSWREQPERALVTMGGSDISNLMPTVIRAFDGFDIHVDAIVGPGFSEAQERSIRVATEEISADVSVERDPDDLVERMFQADFAVSTSSSTTYELLALGTPIISVPVADNQELIARSLHERDVATVLERMPDRSAILSVIDEYISDSSLRKQRLEYGRELVDGKGVKRVASAIETQIDI